MGDVLNPKIMAWFQKRGISEATVKKAGIFSGDWMERDDGTHTVGAVPTGRVAVFPFVEHGRTVAEKYRWGGKKFAQRPGGRKTFFNADALDAEALISGAASLVIVEGEMDALSVMDAGYPHVVSVPDGAPPGRDDAGNIISVPDNTDDIDPEHDEKFSYIVNNWDRLQKIKRIIIFTDNDDAGRRLAAELVRRLGRVRCAHVNYPVGANDIIPKDANEILLDFGPKTLMEVITNAQPYPVSGVYKLSNFPVEPDLRFVSTGFELLDAHLKLFHPSLVVVTGKASSGKSTFTMQMAAQVAESQKWNIGIASFEMRVRPYVTGGLTAAYINKPKSMWTKEDYARADAWIEERVVFIAPDAEDDDTHDIPWLISRMQTAVIRYGVRLMVVDPWNEIDHTPQKGESSTDYVGRALRLLKQFARTYDVCLVIVAHPTKSGASKKSDEISLYDISDSAHFANKADVGIVVARVGEDFYSTTTGIHVRKIRYQPDAGELGEVKMTFDRDRRMFVPMDASPEVRVVYDGGKSYTYQRPQPPALLEQPF